MKTEHDDDEEEDQGEEEDRKEPKLMTITLTKRKSPIGRAYVAMHLEFPDGRDRLRDVFMRPEQATAMAHTILRMTEEIGKAGKVAEIGS